MIDWHTSPKQFCENISAAFSKEAFLLGLVSGEEKRVYALTPQHMKRLSQYLQVQVGEYEKKHGAIEADWKPGIESPFQSKDIEGDK